jgi:hypothetical protein
MNRTEQGFLRILVRSAAAALVGLALALPAAAQDSAKSARKDLALKGDAVCTRCHGVDEEYPVLAIGATKHGTDLTGFFCARLNVVFFNLEEGVYEWRTRSMARSRRS